VAATGACLSPLQFTSALLPAAVGSELLTRVNEIEHLRRTRDRRRHLLGLFLAGRVMVGAGVLNATLYETPCPIIKRACLADRACAVLMLDDPRVASRREL
jgi:hypothetical protein